MAALTENFNINAEIIPFDQTTASFGSRQPYAQFFYPISETTTAVGVADTSDISLTLQAVQNYVMVVDSLVLTGTDSGGTNSILNGTFKYSPMGREFGDNFGTARWPLRAIRPQTSAAVLLFTSIYQVTAGTGVPFTEDFLPSGCPVDGSDNLLLTLFSDGEAPAVTLRGEVRGRLYHYSQYLAFPLPRRP